MAQDLKSRGVYIQVFFALMLLVLIGKAAQLQIVDQSSKSKAESTTVDKVPIYPARGAIYDRDTNLLVYNIPTYNLMVTHNLVDPNMDVEKFCSILGITKEQYRKNLDKNWGTNGLSKDQQYSKTKPFPFLSRLSEETYARLQESLYEFQGFFVELRYVRGYNYPNAAHVLGYLNEVSATQIKASNEYTIGDYIGATGLEAVYDKELRGKKGYRYVLKDNMNREVGTFQDGALDALNRAKSGKDIITTIDIELQAYCESLMANKKGAIVVIEPKSGEILSMLSAPTYDPNLLVFNRSRGRAYTELSTDATLPLYNRAVFSMQPPGSIFKTVVGLIALQEGVTSINRTIPCYSGYAINGKVQMGCHKHPTCTSISEAIQHSCNAYFAHLFRNIVDMKGYTNPVAGLDIFNSYLERFGIGKELGIDFTRENKGNFPTSNYYNESYKKRGEDRWYSSYIMSVGIGQGEIQMTPLQIANLAAIIANKGYYYKPHFCKQFVEDKVAQPKYDQFRVQNNVYVQRKYFDPIIEGMEDVVRAGTGYRAYIPQIPICGKTGTVQNPHGEDHSVFFAFAPKDDPKIALAVYVEHGSAGGFIAAPMASLIIEKYLNGNISPVRRDREQFVKTLNLMVSP